MTPAIATAPARHPPLLRLHGLQERQPLLSVRLRVSSRRRVLLPQPRRLSPRRVSTARWRRSRLPQPLPRLLRSRRPRLPTLL